MKPIKAIFKTVLAGLAALVILSALMLGYYFMPLRESNPKQNTDYVWAPNTLWASLTEGVSYGVTDADGTVVETGGVSLLTHMHPTAAPGSPSTPTPTV